MTAEGGVVGIRIYILHMYPCEFYKKKKKKPRKHKNIFKKLIHRICADLKVKDKYTITHWKLTYEQSYIMK